MVSITAPNTNGDVELISLLSHPPGEARGACDQNPVMTVPGDEP